MSNHFEFDYNVVRELDPSYEKYLHNKAEGPEITDCFDTVEVSIDIADRIMQQAHRQQHMQQAHAHDNPPTAWHGRDLDEDELDIVGMMHGEDETDLESPLDLDVNGMAITSTASTSKTEWVLKREYENPPLHGAKVNPLQLLPPKTVLGGDSVILKTPQILYRVGLESHRGLAKTLYRSKFTDASDNGKLRLIHCPYWFDPILNAMSQQKKGFQSIIYNIETRRLYVRRFVGRGVKGPKNRYKSVVRGIAFNTISLTRAYESMPPVIYLQFIQKLLEVVLKDVPDAYIPHSKYLDEYIMDLQNGIEHTIDASHFVYLTSILVLQHKLGQRIDWLDEGIFYSVSPLLNENHVCNYFDSFDPQVDGDRAKKCSSYRNARLSAIRKCLKQKPGLKSFARALFGKQYSRFAFTMLLHKIESHDLVRLLAVVNDGRMPKNIYHYVVKLLKGKPSGVDVSSTLNTIASSIISNYTDDTRKQRLYTCLTTYDRLGELPGHRGWQRWKDMYNMAERLHIRIRPNKFTNIEGIDILHDKLSDIHNRDERIQLEYADVVFEPFAHPDKEYGDGFKFVFLDTPQALVEEGIAMHHCVGSYADRCIQGGSIMFSMRNDDRSYITIELNGDTYEIKQKYTIKDYTVKNQDILDMIDRWRGDVLDMHMDENASKSYRTICDRKMIEQKEARRKESQEQLVKDGSLDGTIQSTQQPAPAMVIDDFEDAIAF